MAVVTFSATYHRNAQTRAREREHFSSLLVKIIVVVWETVINCTTGYMLQLGTTVNKIINSNLKRQEINRQGRSVITARLAVWEW